MTPTALICYKCRRPMWLPEELYVAAKASPDIIFYCAYGHSQHFAEGESEEAKLRRERDRLKQQMAHRDDVIRALDADVKALKKRNATAKGRITKLAKRAEAGVCPCCHRTFANMQNHMHTKHPGFAAEAIKEL